MQPETQPRLCYRSSAVRIPLPLPLGLNESCTCFATAAGAGPGHWTLDAKAGHTPLELLETG